MRKIDELKDKHKMFEKESEENVQKLRNMEEKLKEIKRENGELILDNERLLKRNKELEKQVSILKNYVEKDSALIKYEGYLTVQPYLFKGDEEAQEKPTLDIIDKGKKKS